MIEEAYCSFETCKLLQGKGFNEVCQRTYYIEEPNVILGSDGLDFRNSELTEDTITVPTLQMAMRWLREIHHIYICPEYKAFFQEKPKKIYHHWCNKIIGIDRFFKQGIQDLDKLDSDYFYFHSCKTYHDIYEDACEECIEFTLKNLI